MLLLVMLLAPKSARSQSTSVYTPRHSVGSVVVNKVLYIASGSMSVTGTLSTTDTFGLPLSNSFNTDAAPWKRLKAGTFASDARMTASADGTHLVLVGTGEPTLTRIYDIRADSWYYIPQSGLTSLQITPRFSPGVVLDSSTGVIVVFGGYYRTSSILSMEVDLVIANAYDFNTWQWSYPSYNADMGAIFQPVMVFLPQYKATLIMGGCSTYIPDILSSGDCLNYTTGYLVQTQVTAVFGNATYTLGRVPLKGAISPTGSSSSTPPPRLSPCYTLLNNGDVLLYGGRTFEGVLSDVWVLRTQDWTWSTVQVEGLPPGGRAGAACQLVTSNQVIVVGGYSGPINGTKHFVQPQIGIINTDRWTWGSNFEAEASQVALSLGIIIGIAAGVCVMLGIIALIAWRIFGENIKARLKRFNNSNSNSNNSSSNGKKNKSKDTSSQESHSDDPHMDGETATPSASSDRLNSSNLLSSRNVSFAPKPSLTDIGVGGGSGSSRSLLSKTTRSDSGSSLPLIITPYSPTESMTSTSFPRATTDSPVSRTKNNNQSQHTMHRTDYEFPESERLPHTTADIQYGHYIRTLQHNKQYEKRRKDLQKQQPRSLNRSDTTSLSHSRSEAVDDPQNQPCIATGLVHLRDVEVGEEPVGSMIPMQTLDTGTMLISSHFDTSSALTETNPSIYGSSGRPSTIPPIPMPMISSGGVSMGTSAVRDASPWDQGHHYYAPMKTVLESDNDEDRDIHGSDRVGQDGQRVVSATGNQLSRSGLTVGQRQVSCARGEGVEMSLPPKAELISGESIESEVLVDNRKSRKSK
ncbi:hypothetical protein EDD11_002545 [Mortierella claussenii]|nr:hypothetical protein EDD11_002545 [Mortierella claussenii]